MLKPKKKNETPRVLFARQNADYERVRCMEHKLREGKKGSECKHHTENQPDGPRRVGDEWKQVANATTLV